MMAAERPAPSLLPEWCPPARGRLAANAPLGRQTWFRAGGTAEVLFRPADQGDLAAFLRALPAEVPVTAVGVGSNLIVRDGGVAGVVVRLGGPFAAIEAAPDAVLAGAGALDLGVAEAAARAGAAGLEFLSGIPGTIGGAIAMNAGAYGADTAGVLDWAEYVTRDGTLVRATPAELGMGYRHGGLPDGAIAIAARLRSTPGDPAAIAARMAEIRAAREASQPVRARTGGSTFANPDGGRAWELIDLAGCRGLTHGSALGGSVRVSEKHTNFLIADGDIEAADIEALGDAVRARVLAQSGVKLRWEIRRIGRPVLRRATP